MLLSAGKLQTDNALAEFSGHVICEPPNADLHSFSGRFVHENRSFPLNVSNILFRVFFSCLSKGMVLRNTEWLIGLVIFSGNDTKLMMNSSGARFKHTNVFFQFDTD